MKSLLERIRQRNVRRRTGREFTYWYLNHKFYQTNRKLSEEEKGILWKCPESMYKKLFFICHGTWKLIDRKMIMKEANV